MFYPIIDPVAFTIGPLSIYWYGLTYLTGFLAFVLLGRYRIHRGLAPDWNPDEVMCLLSYIAFGVLVGGRVGYILFYNLNPTAFLEVWKGGMSFHGGLLGVAAGCFFFSTKHAKSFFAVTDFIAPLAPIGLGLGRIGNFINAELPGRITDLPFGVHFPDGNGGYETVARHLSSAYQATTDGVILFLLVWWFSHKTRRPGEVSAMFLVGYGTFRFLTEFFRQPDTQKGFVVGDWMTMGQVLSTAMILFGLSLFLLLSRKNITARFS